MVYVLLAPGFEESEAIVPTDLLRQGGLETALVSLSGPTVTGGHNITVQADLELSQVEMCIRDRPGTGGCHRLYQNAGKTPAG